MAELTQRQITILKHVIDEYIETAAPVGSLTLDKKFNLGVSPATLRNEMATLSEMGYLTQPHTSAGRAPTPLALKYYVTYLMQPKTLSVTDEVSIKEKVWDYRKEFEKALREATKELASRTKSLAVATDTEGNSYYSGTAHILDMPEFFDIELTRHVLSLLDHFEYLDRIFDRAEGESEIHVLLGDDLGQTALVSCGVIFTRFGKDKKHQGVIGIIGPCRFNYPRVIPTVRYFGNLIDEMVTSW